MKVELDIKEEDINIIIYALRRHSKACKLDSEEPGLPKRVRDQARVEWCNTMDLLNQISCKTESSLV